MWRKKYYENPRRLALAAIAKETEATTPTIASSLPALDPAKSEKLDLASLPPLQPSKCPRFRLTNKPNLHGTTARVFNQDSFDAAIAMPSSVLGIESSPEKPTQAVEADILGHLKSLAASPNNLIPTAAARVAVLNMASERNPGGGWLKGAAAQEEALCFRSTLAASLHRNLYPIERRAGLYTRDVVIFRTSTTDGHKLMVPETAATELAVVSVLTVAGIRRPDVKPAGEDAEDETKGPEGVTSSHSEATDQPRRGNTKSREKPEGPFVFADPAARELTKDKMRLCLRMAAANGHTMLVLGAIGCGAFRNPPQEVADCWLEVLSESEFAGGWFKEIWFAVYDRRKEGNFEIFTDAFEGRVLATER
jgi:hypothetical protein